MRLQPWILLLSLGGAAGCTHEEDAAKKAEETTDETGVAPLPMSTDRRVLHEVFTGSNCGPCLGADALLDDVFHETTRPYSVIKYQLGSDPYMSREGVRRRMHYLPDAETYSIPYVHADGTNGFHPAQINDDAGYSVDDLDGWAEMPSVLSLSVSHEVTDQTVDFQVEMLALDDLDSEKLVLHAAIIENKTTGNVGANGQTEFHQVMKKMVPDDGGTAIEPMLREDSLTWDLSYTFTGEYDDDTSITNMVDHAAAHTVEEFTDLEVVVFIQDTETWEVHQSAWTID